MNHLEIIILKEHSVVFLLCISTVEVLKNTVKILELNILKRILKKKLMYVLENYENISERINNYPFNSDLMCSEFLNLFEEMLENKQAILNVRNSLDYGLFEKTIYKLKKNIKSFINQRKKLLFLFFYKINQYCTFLK